MKRTIIAVIITAVICISGTAFATNLISAENVDYDENTTVKDKLDSLYTTQTERITTLENTINSFTYSDYFALLSGQNLFIYLPLVSNNFNYFNVSLLGSGSSANCEISTNNAGHQKINDISFNTDYSTKNSNVSDYRIYLAANNGWCTYRITYHN